MLDEKKIIEGKVALLQINDYIRLSGAMEFKDSVYKITEDKIYFRDILDSCYSVNKKTGFLLSGLELIINDKEIVWEQTPWQTGI